ncbi:MAG: Panacea domain-containing protein [Bacteroidota bacterium]
MCIHLQFNHKKAAQALNFLAIKAGGRISKLRALKLIFFADRYHLRKYGRPITNDEYFAMPYGPVASSVKDIAEFSEFLGDSEREYASSFIKPSGHDVVSKGEYDKKIFSNSDLESLEFAWKKFGRVNDFRLAKITHLYPEWKKHESALVEKSVTRVKMRYEDFFEDPTADVEKCFDLTGKEKAARLAHIKEISKIEAMLG